MTAVALVLAAGQGTRLGAGLPKALVRVAGRTLLHWSADALGRAPSIEAVLPVVSVGAEVALEELARSWRGPAGRSRPATGSFASRPSASG